jgi:hypothetical protein
MRKLIRSVAQLGWEFVVRICSVVFGALVAVLVLAVDVVTVTVVVPAACTDHGDDQRTEQYCMVEPEPKHCCIPQNTKHR